MALPSLIAATVAVFGLAPSAADAAAIPCPSPATTSLNGSDLYISPCAGEITVTSPLVHTVYGSPDNDVIHAALNVETVYAGEGEDVVYAGPETTLVNGGPGDDKIYGEPLENELGTEPIPYEPEVEYEPATPAEAARAKQAAPPISDVLDRGPIATASRECGAENPCFGGTGDQVLEGGEGNDEIFGQRGNDELLGDEGNDALYGGIGDDNLHGGPEIPKAGPEDDFLAGGPGADQIRGENGNDLVRGDATIDTLHGEAGNDTLSFSTGVTPGFEYAYPTADGVKAVSGFPEANSGEGRGVYVRLEGANSNCSEGAYAACNGRAGYGGGDDAIEASSFENVIGTAFADVIVGSSGANKLYGGGGGDVIVGSGGADELYGGAEGDYLEDSGSGTAYGGKGTNNCVGVAAKSECSGSEAKVSQHSTTTMSAGLMMNKNPVVAHDTVYLLGTEGADKVNAHYVESTHEVTFSSAGTTKFGGESEGCTYEEGGKPASEGKTAKCPLPASSNSLDAVVLAGLGGTDRLTVGGAPNFPLTSSPLLLGGQNEAGKEKEDVLVGSGTTEDVLVDGNGPGWDVLEGFGYDDGLLNNEGVDRLEGGAGNDLLLSTTNCDGDTLQGGREGEPDKEAKNDASWAKLPAPLGVVATIKKQSAGSGYNETTEAATCATGSPDQLFGIDDLEGSPEKDLLIGGEHENLLIGHKGEDSLLGEEGVDKLNAQDGAKDKVIGGPPAPPEPQEDECVVDLAIDEVAGCEHTLPPPSTETTIANPEPHDGTPGSVDVKGNVEAKASLAGRHVFIEYEKEEGGKFVLKDRPEVALAENGNYTDSEGVGVGKWRVRAVFPEQGNYKPSASMYKEFTINAK